MARLHIVAFFITLVLANTAWGGFLVVIDPGHGGADYGTLYRSGSYRIAEKDITLLLALQVAEKLRARGIQVRLTRTDDREIALPSRTAMANRLKADLFLSIHMNSGDRKAEGFETFILNHSSDAASRRLVQLENAVLGHSSHSMDLVVSQAHAEARGNAGSNAEVALILKDLLLDANLAESKRLACLVQNQLSSANTRNRGVKQGLFYVLLGADMPSALVEAGFLSSTKDRTAVLSADGQSRISKSIAQAVDRFRLERGTPASHRVLSSCLIH